MLKTPVLVIGVLFAGVLMFAAVTPDVTVALEEARTDAASDAGLGCTTNPGETTCDVSLIEQHQWSDTRYMAVTRTFPGAADDLANSTLGADQQTVTIAGLTQNTTYSWDIDYLKLNPNLANMPFIAGWLHAGGWGLIMVGFVIVFLAVVKVGDVLT